MQFFSKHRALLAFLFWSLCASALIAADIPLRAYFYLHPFSYEEYTHLFPFLLGLLAFLSISAHRRIRSGKAVTVLCELFLVAAVFLSRYAVWRMYQALLPNHTFLLAVLACCLVSTLIRRQEDPV